MQTCLYIRSDRTWCLCLQLPSAAAIANRCIASFVASAGGGGGGVVVVDVPMEG
jgi:hypothetical protein